jgi:hypothetical protein
MWISVESRERETRSPQSYSLSTISPQDVRVSAGSCSRSQPSSRKATHRGSPSSTRSRSSDASTLMRRHGSATTRLEGTSELAVDSSAVLPDAEITVAEPSKSPAHPVRTAASEVDATTPRTRMADFSIHRAQRRRVTDEMNVRRYRAHVPVQRVHAVIARESFSVNVASSAGIAVARVVGTTGAAISANFAALRMGRLATSCTTSLPVRAGRRPLASHDLCDCRLAVDGLRQASPRVVVDPSIMPAPSRPAT